MDSTGLNCKIDDPDIESRIKCEMDTFFSNIFKISDDEVFTVSQYSQRSSEWFNERKNRLTASNFGAALDRNPYCSSDALLVQLLYKSFSGNAATQYGTTNEPIACNQYLDDIEMMGKTRTGGTRTEGCKP